jgi:hypothetical protein
MGSLVACQKAWLNQNARLTKPRLDSESTSWLRPSAPWILTVLYAADIVSFDIEPPLQHAGAEAKRTNWSWLIAHDSVSVLLGLESGSALLNLEP